MNQQKMGCFLKELRKCKGITQEQLSEYFNVSNRTVSRWETGTNMPDISVLVEIADFYDVDIREIIDGERKSEKMDEKEKDTASKMAEYANIEKTNLLKRIRQESISGVIALIAYIIIKLIGIAEKNFLFEMLESASLIIICLTPIMITLHTTGVLLKFERRNLMKNTPKWLKILTLLIATIAIASIIVLVNLLLK